MQKQRKKEEVEEIGEARGNGRFAEEIKQEETAEKKRHEATEQRMEREEESTREAKAEEKKKMKKKKPKIEKKKRGKKSMIRGIRGILKTGGYSQNFIKI